MLVANTTFENTFVDFCLNITTFGVLIDIVGIDKSRDFGCYGHHLAGNYEFPSYTKMCVFIKWPGAASLQ